VIAGELNKRQNLHAYERRGGLCPDKRNKSILLMIFQRKILIRLRERNLMCKVALKELEKFQEAVDTFVFRKDAM
jgi:hypothetical protein